HFSHSEFRISPPVAATVHTTAARTAAILQFVDLARANKEGRLIAGPANKKAATAPTGAPAERNPRASGTSKNVGSAKGTAIEAAARTAKNRKPLEASNPAGTYWMRSMEDTTPRTRAGTVRMSISSSDPKNAEAVSCKPAGVLYSVRFLLKRDVSRVKRRSITKPPRNTVTAAISRRAAATLGAKSRNVRTSAAGF